MSLHFFFFLFNEFYLSYSKLYLRFSLNCSLVLIAFSQSFKHILIILGILVCKCRKRNSCRGRLDYHSLKN